MSFSLPSTTICSASTEATVPALSARMTSPGVERGAPLHSGPDQRGLGLEQRHGLALHVRAHQGAVRVVVLEEGDHGRRHRPDLVGRDIHQVHVLGLDGHVLPGLGAAQDVGTLELAGLLVQRRVGLGDDLVLLLGGVEADDVVGDDAILDHAVGRLDEAELRHGGEGRQGPDQADVRALRRLDRTHAAVVGRMDVAHLDGRALARQTARAERREAAAMREAGQRVRLVHELRELAGAEELLQGRHHGADVHDRLGRDRVGVLGGEALAHDALHSVQADAERLLDELADRAQAPVAEVLVLVEAVLDRLAGHHQRLRREVLDLLVGLLGQAEVARERHELLDQGDDVLAREHARVEVDLQAQALVELVAADPGQVVALGIEEELVEQGPRVVDARRLAGALLLEQLDEGALLGLGALGVGGDRVADVERVVEELEDLLVGLVAHGPQEHRDRQLALAVDADEDLALLVDLQLQPGAARRHEVGDEDLLLGVLGLHHIGAGGAHELRDDHALGAVDDERAPVGHPGEIAHEDLLLADLARLAVDEGDGHVQGSRVGEVLLATLLDGSHGVVELELTEVDGQVAGVVLDRRDVVDRLAQAAGLGVGQPRERAALNIDEVGNFKNLVQTREATARPRSINCGHGGSSGSSGIQGGTGARSAASQDSTAG